MKHKCLNCGCEFSETILSESTEDHCEHCGNSCELADGSTCPDCCPHDEHDHGICLDCGKDIMDDLVGRSELLRDE